MMSDKKVCVVTSRKLAKSGGIIPVTQTLFGGTYEILFMETMKKRGFEKALKDFDTVIFSGFDASFVEVAEWLKEKGKKIAVFWHFATASEADKEISDAWNAVWAVKDMIDLFITPKKSMAMLAEKLFKLKTFFIMNNSKMQAYKGYSKKGVGVYTGSGTYWPKNFRSNLFAAMMTGRKVDIIPYDGATRAMVETLGGDVSGSEEVLEHEQFLRRMAGRELVFYVTFTEGNPILPLEALNNGVICIMGNNTDYFENNPVLRQALVCKRPDDIKEILRLATSALNNKKIIFKNYEAWKSEYDKAQQNNFEEFKAVIAEL